MQEPMCDKSFHFFYVCVKFLLSPVNDFQSLLSVNPLFILNWVHCAIFLEQDKIYDVNGDMVSYKALIALCKQIDRFPQSPWHKRS